MTKKIILEFTVYMKIKLKINNVKSNQKRSLVRYKVKSLLRDTNNHKRLINTKIYGRKSSYSIWPSSVDTISQFKIHNI